MRAWSLFLALAGCAHVAPAPAPTGATCASVCAHEVALECAAGWPTQKGTSCVEVCQNINLSGIVTLDLSCMAAAPTCAAIDACGRHIEN